MAQVLVFNTPVNQMTDKEIKARLSVFITNLLTGYDISQRKLARWLRITVSRLNGYYKGNQLPRADILIKIAEIGGLTIDDLLKTDNPPVIGGQPVTDHKKVCSRKDDEIKSSDIKPSINPLQKIYIGTKIIAAYPMDRVTFLKREKGEACPDMITEPGYRIEYRDGYISWCPKDEFESTHREVTEAETRVISHG